METFILMVKVFSLINGIMIKVMLMEEKLYDDAILVIPNLEYTDFELAEMKEELINLSEACDLLIKDTVVQNIKTKNNAYFIGSGKVEEVKRYVDANKASVVVFSVGLTPSQLRNLTEILDCEVIDKNMLILEIFSRRAQSPEAKAQVEIANLKYMMSRMIGSYTELGRQVGGAGRKNRGLGETKLELDRRHAEKRIQFLRGELVKYEKNREMQRNKRQESVLPKVALLGYTNAGKSSLMNSLLEESPEKHVFVKDQLFASLETHSRKIDLDDKHSFILHDTVGFVRELPHTLINAFHSTLKEIEDADLLIHVIDRSNPFYEQHMEVIDKTIEELEASSIPMIKVYNKIDLLNEDFINNTHSFFISTYTNEGIEELKEVIKGILWEDTSEVEVFIPYNMMRDVDVLMQNGVILDYQDEEDGVRMHVRIGYDQRHLVEKYMIQSEVKYEA